MKKINIKAFWKGTIVADLTFTEKQYEVVQKQLKQDFFSGCDNIDEFIEIMNHNEKCFAYEYSKKGFYEIGDLRTQTLYMLGVNSIVRKGLRPNDNNYGLVRMISQ